MYRNCQPQTRAFTVIVIMACSGPDMVKTNSVEHPTLLDIPSAVKLRARTFQLRLGSLPHNTSGVEHCAWQDVPSGVEYPAWLKLNTSEGEHLAWQDVPFEVEHPAWQDIVHNLSPQMSGALAIRLILGSTRL